MLPLRARIGVPPQHYRCALCGPRAPPNWEHIRGSGWTRTRGRKSPRRPRSVPPSPATLRIRDRAVLWTRLQRTPITTFLSRVICAAHGHRPSGTSRFQPPSTRYHPVIVEAVTSPHGVDVSQEPVQSTGPSGPFGSVCFAVNMMSHRAFPGTFPSEEYVWTPCRACRCRSSGRFPRRDHVPGGCRSLRQGLGLPRLWRPPLGLLSAPRMCYSERTEFRLGNLREPLPRPLDPPPAPFHAYALTPLGRMSALPWHTGSDHRGQERLEAARWREDEWWVKTSIFCCARRRAMV